MRQFQDDAFVLDTQPLGEADRVVTLLTRGQGALRAVARAGRSSRRRFGGRLEPLTLVRASWLEREGRELHRLEDADVLRSFAAMQAEPRIQAACAVLAEVTRGVSREGQAEPGAFRLLEAVLAALETGAGPCLAVRYFEYWMLRLHGLLPELSRCAACGAALSARQAIRIGAHGEIRCRGCPAESRARLGTLGPLEWRFLDAARRLPPDRLPPELAALRCGGTLERLLRGALEGFVERSFRSYRHLDAAENAGSAA
jgi:DNA repair protein RecO (recombination protein O)